MFRNAIYGPGTLLFAAWLAGCSTVHQPLSGEREPLTEASVESGEKEESLPAPEWYSHEIPGRYAEGTLTGLAHASGSDASWALEIAERTAYANLIYWLDSQIEEARSGDAQSSMSRNVNPALLELRLAVQNLDLSRSVSDSYQTEGEEGVHHIYVRLEISSEEIKRQLDESASTEWVRIRELEPVGSW